MPAYNISLKDGASSDELDKAKKSVTDKGGKITKEFKLIKGFTAEIPADHVSTLESSPHLDVEEDKEVRIQ